MFSTCFAQTEKSLSLDEQGKYIFYEVIETPSVSKDSLINRTQNFFKTLKHKNVILKSSIDSLFKAEGKFIIHKGSSMFGHPAAEVLFNFVAEIKEGKYRYWLTDFKIVAYQRDRYANFVPASTIYRNLEDSPGKIDSQDWKGKITNTANQAYKFGENFKKHLARAHNTPVLKKSKSISKQAW